MVKTFVVLNNLQVTKAHYCTLVGTSETIRGLSTKSNHNSWNPYFITGLADAEGCFHISIRKVNWGLGWRVEAKFSLRLHKKDLALLNSFQTFFSPKVGKIVNNADGSVGFSVFSLKD